MYGHRVCGYTVKYPCFRRDFYSYGFAAFGFIKMQYAVVSWAVPQLYPHADMNYIFKLYIYIVLKDTHTSKQTNTDI
jgi:hypothetical protein